MTASETKIIGLVGVAGGHVGAINSLNTMKTICRNLHCWVLPQEVSIANSSQSFNDDGTAMLIVSRYQGSINRNVVKPFCTPQRQTNSITNQTARGERKMESGVPSRYGWVGGGSAKLWVDTKERFIAYIGFPLTPPGDNALLVEFEQRVYDLFEELQ